MEQKLKAIEDYVGKNNGKLVKYLLTSKESGQALLETLIDLVKLKLTSMPLASICSITESLVHIGQADLVDTW